VGQTVKNLTTVDKDIIDLYAVWEGKKITISFDKNGGNGSMPTKTYTYGKNETLDTKTFSWSKHSFAGWALTSDGDVKYSDGNLVDPIILNEASPLILYAKWIDNENAVTVLYEGNGGTINGQNTTSKTVTKGSTFEALTAVRDGYTHTGYVNKNGVAFTNTTIINVATVAYATWTENEYTLSYNGKGATKGGLAAETHKYTEVYALPANNFAKVGYDFQGWDTEEAGKTVVYKDKASVSKLAKSGTVAMSAVWSPRTYNIKYNANGGSGNVDNTTFTYNTNAYLTNTKYTLANHNQDGWIYRKSDGTEVKFGPGAQITNDSFELDYDTREITLYANFVEKSFTAVLRANGGVFANGANEKSTAIKYNAAVSFEEPTRVGYIFSGYTVAGAKLAEVWTYTTSDQTYVDANWTPISYTIVFNANGGQNTMDAMNVAYDENKKLTKNAFTKQGFDFDGWTFDGKDYADQAEVKNLSSVDGTIVTMVAKWKGKNYTINYYANDGSDKATSETVVYGKDHGLKANTYTRTQYTFNGWALSEKTQAVYADKATISSIEAYQPVINLYASWVLSSSIKGTLVLNGNGGLVNGSETYTANYSDGEDIPIPALERVGYVFTGWTKDGSNYTFPDVCNFDGTLNLSANWRKIKYNLIYHANNGTNTETVVSDIEYDTEVVIAANSFTKENYHFEYWSKTSDGEKAFVPNDRASKLTVVDGDKIHLYAIWAGDKFTITLNGSNPTTGRVSTTSYVYGENKDIPANTFTKNGHKFSGWTL
ncbi:MAG: InlB B-repeat-containing protein, partial [Lachnospiraceae bacterium]|nr:InlB B-repeat-containing protein [Lachnospiraceae bacterium]